MRGPTRRRSAAASASTGFQKRHDLVREAVGLKRRVGLLIALEGAPTALERDATASHRYSMCRRRAQ